MTQNAMQLSREDAELIVMALRYRALSFIGTEESNSLADEIEEWAERQEW